MTDTFELDPRRLVAECLGTALLVIVGAGSIMTDLLSGHAVGVVGIALSFTLVITAVIVAAGHVSGAHINPAVTIALWSIRRFPSREVVPYVMAQCAGAILGAYLLRISLGDVGSVGATVPHVAAAVAFGVEFVFSFALMFVIAAVAGDPRTQGGIGPLAIGGTVGFCACQGWLTGASMNPARSLGPAIAAGVWTLHWIYWVAPISGMLVAARLHVWLHPPEVSGHLPAVRLGAEGPIDP